MLIYIGAHYEAKIEDYWCTPRSPNGSISDIKRYINLRRFQMIYQLFTATPNSIDDLQDNIQESQNKQISRRKFADTPKTFILA
jgi:hypothetical protein